MGVALHPIGPPPGPLATVFQKDLEEYQVLDNLVRQREVLRQSLLDKLGSGALVEPGRLTAHVDVHEQRCPPTWPTLLQWLGESVVEYLRPRMGTKQYRRLIITETDPSAPPVALSLLIYPVRPRGNNPS